MSNDDKPTIRRRSITEPPTPFNVLARTHGMMIASDTIMTLALADSLFLSISPDAARGKVLLYLLLTFAPFTLISRNIGPLLDRMRGGRRLAIALIAIGRAVVSVLMVRTIDGLALFPLAFIALVLSKSYAISKSAIVPSVVKEEKELVEANSKLGLVAGISGFIVVPIALILQLISPKLTLFFSAIMFVATAVVALQLPRSKPPEPKASRVDAETASSLNEQVTKAANAMGLLRASIGFLTFHLAFWLRGETAGVFWVGTALAFTTVGAATANTIGPKMRDRAREEMMLQISGVLLAVVGIIAALAGNPLAAVFVAFATSFATSIGRLAFDAVVQRDAPETNRAQRFAKFETQFQMKWILAGVVPVLIPIPGQVGFLIISIMGIVAVLQLRGSHPDWTPKMFRGRS